MLQTFLGTEEQRLSPSTRRRSPAPGRTLVTTTGLLRTEVTLRPFTARGAGVAAPATCRLA